MANEKKNEKSEQGQQASARENKGQDENLHNFVNPVTGATERRTQRWFRNEGEDLGFVKGEDLKPEELEDRSTAAPPVAASADATAEFGTLNEDQVAALDARTEDSAE